MPVAHARVLGVEASHSARVPPSQPYHIAPGAPGAMEDNSLRHVTDLAAGVEEAHREVVILGRGKARPGAEPLVVAANLQHHLARQRDVRAGDHLTRLAAAKDL